MPTPTKRQEQFPPLYYALDDDMRPMLRKNDATGQRVLAVVLSGYRYPDPSPIQWAQYAERAINQHAALVEALRGLVNVCTHPQSTKADMRLIAEEARQALAQAKHD